MFRSDWYKNWADRENFAKAPVPGVRLDALKYLHLERKILFHGHEALDTDTTPTLEGEYWLMHNHFAQAEGVANLDKVPEAGAIIAIGFAKIGRANVRTPVTNSQLVCRLPLSKIYIQTLVLTIP